MVDLKLLLVFGLAFVHCLAQEGVTYLRSGVASSEFNSDEHGTYAGKRRTSCVCGIANKASGRIVGGVFTKVNEYPHTVGIVRIDGDELRTFCGGTVLTKRHVLTAAHCTEGEVAKGLGILAGGHDLRSETPYTALYRVAEIIDHSQYNPDTVEYDISLLVTEEMEFNTGVRPICLPTGPLNLLDQHVKITGWGDTRENGNASPVLKKVNLRVVELKTCAKHYGGDINLKDVHQFCTYSVNKDSCQGDSGGPVIWLDPETNRFTLAGVVSYGKGCARPIPGVNTDVSRLVPWILHHINKNPKYKSPTCTKV